MWTLGGGQAVSEQELCVFEELGREPRKEDCGRLPPQGQGCTCAGVTGKQGGFKPLSDVIGFVLGKYHCGCGAEMTGGTWTPGRQLGINAILEVDAGRGTSK